MSGALDLAELHRLTPDEYHQLIESGGFDEATRVELINGLLCNMSPKTREHEQAIEWLIRFLAAATDAAAYRLRVTSPLSLGRSEPEPDLALVEHGTPQIYHPSSAALVIEVSVSSRARELRVKPSVYAAAGVAEYWVVDLARRCVIVHGSPDGGAYQDVSTVPPSGTVRARAIALPEIVVSELLAAAEA